MGTIRAPKKSDTTDSPIDCILPYRSYVTKTAVISASAVSQKMDMGNARGNDVFQSRSSKKTTTPPIARKSGKQLSTSTPADFPVLLGKQPIILISNVREGFNTLTLVSISQSDASTTLQSPGRISPL